MDVRDAELYIRLFEQYFSKDQLTDVDQSITRNKKINVAILKMIKIKYVNCDDDDVSISFDPASRTMLLMLMKIIYFSSNKNGYNIDTNFKSIPSGFKTNTVEYMIWTWIYGLINDIGNWDDIVMSDIPNEFEDMSEYYYLSDEHKMNANGTVLAHTVFAMIIDHLSTKISKLFSDPSECGAKGLVIKCYMLRGYFTDMNPGSANPEIFTMLHNAASAFNIVKKAAALSVSNAKKTDNTTKK
jgi:hypothetical protein